VVSIDADLQDPPETIVEMLRVARVDDLDVVYGVWAKSPGIACADPHHPPPRRPLR
jgi:hypothetical protein